MSANRNRDIGVLQLSSLWWKNPGPEQEKDLPKVTQQVWSELGMESINPQSMALFLQSTANKQSTGTKEGNEGQVGACRGAGQAQNKAGV